VGRQRSTAEQQIAELLQTARASLRLSVAFLSRLDGTTQHLEVVESSMPLIFRDGLTQKQETSFCQAILDGRLPAVIPDVRADPVAMKLPTARIPRIRSYVSAPVVLSDGSLYGTFCAFGFTSDKELADRDRALMGVLASAASVIIEPEVRVHARRVEIEERLAPLMDAGGPVVLLQPIVDLATGARVGAEALSRFPAEWGMAPDVVFEQAHSVGLGDRLELLALERAAEHLDHVDGYVAMNVSPGTLLTPECGELLHRLRDSRRHEITDHEPEDDPEHAEADAAPHDATHKRRELAP